MFPRPASPHIVFDARKIRDYGIGTYVRSLSHALGALQGNRRFTALTLDAPGANGPLPADWNRIHVRYGQYSPGEYFFLGRVIRKSQPHLYHATHYAIPRNPGVPTITTIHDVIPLLFPKVFNAAKRLYAYRMIAHALRVSGLIITHAEVTRKELLGRFPCDERSIRTIPLGVDGRFRVGGDREEHAKKFRLQFDIQGPYLLFVSNPKPHKGVDVLLSAFSRIRNIHKDLRLVLIGGNDIDVSLLRAAAEEAGVGDAVRLLGRTSTNTVVGAYCGAEIFVHPSLYEGFGLGVLEAMSTGTPVVCTDAGSLPEVAGEDALVVPKGNVEALVGAVDTLLTDSTLKGRFVASGLRRAARYSWEETARKTIECYDEVLNGD